MKPPADTMSGAEPVEPRRVEFKMGSINNNNNHHNHNRYLSNGTSNGNGNDSSCSSSNIKKHQQRHKSRDILDAKLLRKSDGEADQAPECIGLW